MPCRIFSLRAAVLFIAGATLAGTAAATAVEPVHQLAQQEKPALIATLKDLVSIESGSAFIVPNEQIRYTHCKRIQRATG